jgi:hypothetical protein
MLSRLGGFFFILVSIGCTSISTKAVLFEKLAPTQTGIDFSNSVTYTEDYNVYTYRSFYNGGGVGIGDFNNDGLQDVYLTGNMVSNKLYINQGDFKFKDITEFAGVSCGNSWSTGVSIVDINADGYLDIYVCKSGKPDGANRNNQLFINNGNLTFTDRSKDFGLDIQGLSTHAAFFDYDHDGDLDCYLLTNSIRSIGGFDLRKDQRLVPDPDGGGNKLLKNLDGKFVDVSATAGIYTSQIGFGLGVTIGDFNGDGWEDIYVSNDFFERDYLYFNNHNGTFTEDLESSMPEISLGSMGADFADIDNDGKPDLFVSEMMPASIARIRTAGSFETWDKFESNLRNGYHKQFSRNSLQYNRGNSKFSEISRLAGVEATDWSWGGLIVDLNNDGFKDIFVANGIYKDLLDQDYINYMADPATIRKILKRENVVLKKMIDKMPSVPQPNFVFSNLGNLTFADSTKSWGLLEAGFSNGAAYADLDNDGDMDLVVSNINAPCAVYKNNTEQRQNSNYVKLSIIGSSGNSFSLGTSATVYAANTLFKQEINPFRGFQSSVDTRLNFGLGYLKKIDSIEVEWATGKYSVIKEIDVNQTLVIEESKSEKKIRSIVAKQKTIFRDISYSLGLKHHHEENEFSDFNMDRLLFKMTSTEGPKLAVADINGDGLDDFFVGGAIGQPGSIFENSSDETIKLTKQKNLERDWISEDVGSVFFDADKDGDKDLFVCSGGNEYPSNSNALSNRLYLNNNGIFQKKENALPFGQFFNTSCAVPIDYDRDGDSDLFIGTRSLALLYGIKPSSYLLENDGFGNFKDVTELAARSLRGIGMVTDALKHDLNKDGWDDLVLVGEYIPITILFGSDNGFEHHVKVDAGLEFTNGWWNAIKADDIDNDGDIDLIIGNQGLNNRINPSKQYPMKMIINDFDKNGKIEHFLCAYEGGHFYPLVLRNDLLSQLPSQKKKYLKFNDYKNQQLEDIFSKGQLRNSTELLVYEFQSMILINNGNSFFERQPLPMEAQFAQVYAIEIGDFNRDGIKDVLLGGNLSRAKPEWGINEASYGLLLEGIGLGKFKPISLAQSGLAIRGEIRDIKKVGDDKVIIVKNNGAVQIFEY